MKSEIQKIKVFADGANIESMKEAYKKGLVKGFTTNPSLLKKAGVTDYASFAKKALEAIPDLPISFEVLSDDFPTMEKEARLIGSWGKNVYIKIPITNTKGESSVPLIKKLSAENFQLNITAILTYAQAKKAFDALCPTTPAVISIFGGRIADTGVDPVPIFKKAARLLKAKPKVELLWASPRELYNVFQAAKAGCHIITVTDDILKKFAMIGKNLNELSLETVKMFFNDAEAAGISLL